MYSSEDLERFYFQYQTESLPKGESIQKFCLKNKVPYNLFQKWYKDTRKKVVEVEVVGAPMVSEENRPTEIPEQKSSVSGSCAESVRILVDIRTSSGLHIQQKNLSYESLCLLIEKLEVLC